MPSNVYETSYDNDHLHKWSEIIQTDLARLEGFTSRLAKTQFLGIKSRLKYFFIFYCLIKFFKQIYYKNGLYSVQPFITSK